MMKTLQEGQVAYLRREEGSLMRQEARSYDGYAPLRNYDVTCRTCESSRVLHVPSSVTGFLSLHAGHRTWIVRTL